MKTLEYEILIILLINLSLILIGLIIGLIVKHFKAIKESKVGILFNYKALWIGIHYSAYCKRYCINIIPMITIFIVLKDGQLPNKMFQ